MIIQIDAAIQILILSIAIPVYTAFIIGVFAVPDPKNVSTKGLAIIAGFFFIFELVFSYLTKSWTLFIGSIAINVISFLVYYFWSGKIFQAISFEKRTNTIIAKVGEEIINSLEDSDIGIVAVASDTADAKSDKSTIEKSQKLYDLINDGIRIILSSIKDLFLLDKFNINTQECILTPTKEGKFKVLSHNGLTKNIVDELENSLSYSPVIKGLAGQALASGNDLVISDLSDKSNPLNKDWIKLGDQKREGSLFCIVIKAGVGEKNPSIPLCVFCITAGKLSKDQADNVYQVALRFINKIKILIYFLMMLDTMTVLRNQQE